MKVRTVGVLVLAVVAFGCGRSSDVSSTSTPVSAEERGTAAADGTAATDGTATDTTAATATDIDSTTATDELPPESSAIPETSLTPATSLTPHTSLTPETSTASGSAAVDIVAVTDTPAGFAPLSPDGAFRAYADDDELCIVEIESGSLSCASTDRNALPVVWSPTGGHVLVDAGVMFAGMYVHSIGGDGSIGPSQPLGSNRATYMAWSDDGSSVYATDDGQIVAIDATSGESRSVAPLDVDRFDSAAAAGGWLWYDRRGSTYALDTSTGAQQTFPLANVTHVVATDVTGEMAIVVDSEFIGQFETHPDRPSVFVVDGVGGRTIEIFAPELDVFPRDVGISPDGALVLVLWSGIAGDHSVVTAASVDRDRAVAGELVEVARLDENVGFFGWGVGTPMVWPTPTTARAVGQDGTVVEISVEL